MIQVNTKHLNTNSMTTTDIRTKPAVPTNINHSKQLDQFFTKHHIALLCRQHLSPVLEKISGQDTRDLFFIEPSVGDGVFYDLLPPKKIGIDLEPRRKEFIGEDFLTWDHRSVSYDRRQTVVIGNPPFGKRGNLAIRFFNKASVLADTIAFIVPVIFRKFFVHKHLSPEFKWISTRELPRDAFRLGNKKTYAVNTEFQIWTRTDSEYTNKRLFAPPPISHRDFSMWQYNNTPAALKVFNNDFDFAVPSQGWQDYDRRETDKNKCEKHKQWILFKSRTDSAYERLYKEIDYNKLALKNTTCIPGFRKGDIVQEYIRL